MLPVVEADTGIVVDAKIIASVKIVAAAAIVARYVLCSGGILLLLLVLFFSVFILRASRKGEQRIKELHQLTRKDSTLNQVL